MAHEIGKESLRENPYSSSTAPSFPFGFDLQGALIQEHPLENGRGVSGSRMSVKTNVTVRSECDIRGRCRRVINGTMVGRG